MKVTPSNKPKLFLMAGSIFTLSGFLTILFVVFSLPFLLIITPLIICVTGLVIFSAYGVYIFYRIFFVSRDERLEETTHLLEGRDNIEIGVSNVSAILGATIDNSGRKKSSPRPTPKPKVTHQHPTPMPQQIYLTELVVSKFKALGDFIRSRRHTVSESDAIGLDDIPTDHLKSSRVHTKSESEIVNQSLRCSPNSQTRRKQLAPTREEDLFEMEFGEEYDHGYKKN